MNLREALFRDWPGCTSGDCVVRDNSKGMRTTGSCMCVIYANRTQLHILQSRISALVMSEAQPALVVENGQIVKSQIPIGYTGNLYAHPPQPAPDVAELVEALDRLKGEALCLKYADVDLQTLDRATIMLGIIQAALEKFKEQK